MDKERWTAEITPRWLSLIMPELRGKLMLHSFPLGMTWILDIPGKLPAIFMQTCCSDSSFGDRRPTCEQRTHGKTAVFKDCLALKKKLAGMMKGSAIVVVWTIDLLAMPIDHRYK